jgi:hypothetical protein
VYSQQWLQQSRTNTRGLNQPQIDSLFTLGSPYSSSVFSVLPQTFKMIGPDRPSDTRAFVFANVSGVFDWGLPCLPAVPVVSIWALVRLPLSLTPFAVRYAGQTHFAEWRIKYPGRLFAQNADRRLQHETLPCRWRDPQPTRSVLAPLVNLNSTDYRSIDPKTIDQGIGIVSGYVQKPAPVSAESLSFEGLICGKSPSFKLGAADATEEVAISWIVLPIALETAT